MRSGIDASGIDHEVRPQDDLFGHTNGRWVATHDIPADRGRYGTFDALREQAEQDVRAVITEVGEGSPAPATTGAKVGDLYASFMDEATVDALGATPLADPLDLVRGVDSPAALMAASGRLFRDGVDGLVRPFVNTDDRDPDRYVVYFEQGGLGLPDESYYRDEAHADKLAAYEPHVARMLALGGWADAGAEAEGAAARIVALEKQIGAGHWDKVTNRDPVKTYTLVDRTSLDDLTPGLDWDAWLGGARADASILEAVVVRQPDHLRSAADLVSQVPMATWRDWLAWHVIHEFAPYLSSALVEENFDFYGRILSGVPEMRVRWKRGVALVEAALGEAVGQLYVERHFPPHAKAEMEKLVANLVEAFRRRFQDLEWMGEDTRGEALAKLGAFTPKIGYPAKWRDYSTLEITAGDLVGNVRRASEFEVERNLAKLGGPVDREEWFMTPQTVNAYYNPGMNEIVFPAAILQPPFFDVDADDAVNYGGIGAVIGHEIGHGFDDTGSQFDGDGRLRNWWTEDDRANFQVRADRLIAQFNTLEPLDAPGHTINGALTVGENIGDLCGLAIGHAAYRIAVEASGAEAPVLDDATGDQRFFLGWAQVWRGKAREAEAIRLIALDPHAPMDQRANVARNLEEFHEAFGTQEGDGMWLAPEDRVRIL